MQPDWWSRQLRARLGLPGLPCSRWLAGATGNLIGSNYKTPYAIHITGGVQHAFNEHWLASADYAHEQGNHGYRAFPYTSGTNLFTPLISIVGPELCHRSGKRSAERQCVRSLTTDPVTTP